MRLFESFKKRSFEKNNSLWDGSSLKLIFIASAVIVLAVFLTGGISYTIAKNAVVSKLKSRDLQYIAQSITAKIDGRLEKAIETSSVLAGDPVILNWVKNGEKDEELGKYAIQKIMDLPKYYKYDNSFIVSTITDHYWSESGRIIDTMSKDDPDDSWFFQTITSGKPISIVIDYNRERKDTFAFVNSLMGDPKKPLAVVGVGMNLRDISNEFESYKFGEKSNMWLINDKGNIYISEDADHLGKNITGFLPSEIGNKILSHSRAGNTKSNILEYKNKNGAVFDLICYPISSAGWDLVLQIPRSESVSILNAIKINTAVACLFSIVLITLIFLIISNRIANPYKRAVQLTQIMEKQVQERTRELNEKNEKILDSIEYSKMIQEAILPTADEMTDIFCDHFIIWRPRDIVGGDFYLARKFDTGRVLIVGDCTGHGVPGALMTMAVHSVLNHITDRDSIQDPAQILMKLNIMLKQVLYGKNAKPFVNNGLDAGIIYISASGKAIFAGAKTSVYIKSSEGLQVVKGDKTGIGYRDTDDSCMIHNHDLSCVDDCSLYITTDGFLHQNGGERDFSFGKTRFASIINRYFMQSLQQQKDAFIRELEEYMGNEPQRDDITVVGIKLKGYKE